MDIAVILESITCYLAAKKAFGQQAATELLQILISVPVRKSEITFVGFNMLK